MRNVSVILAIAFSFFVVGFVVNFDEILRLHDGQVQVMEGDEWRCADEDVAQAMWGTLPMYDVKSYAITADDFFDGGEITDTPTLPPEYTDDFIRGLAESGRVCEVMGHLWEDYVQGTGIWEQDGDVIMERMEYGEKCQLCGKVRIQKWEEQ